LLEPLQHGAFAFGIAKREMCRLFECADFQCESRPYVQESKQFDIDFVYFFSPMLYVHGSSSGQQKKPAATFRIAAGSLKVLCFRLSAHRFQTSPSAPLRKEEAVSKGEIEKCASANHNLGLL
jgi:hypothetical protein